jgi:ubiquinone/menaquinone biosynthesis C-methylase UbiE
MTTVKPPDWAEKKTKQEVIVDQRRFLWHDDTVEKLASWMGLTQGMNALDVGCGLGYVGRTFWKHFGKKGSYTGLDNSLPLLREARKQSTEWVRGGTAAFVQGDAKALPFPDGTFDFTVCQTLLMHSPSPNAFLAEMARVTRPGGIVTCFEPDNVTAMRARHYQSFREPSIDDELLYIRVHHHWAEGRKKLGLGDYSIGNRVPGMMQKLGLKEIGIRANDMVGLVQPPYDTPAMAFKLELFRRQVAETEKHCMKRFNIDREFRKLFFAGGGTEHVWRRFTAMSRRHAHEQVEQMKRQCEEATVSACGSSCSFYCITGKKP